VKYRAGDRVRVAARAHEGHHRTPGYVKGKSGRIERVHGMFTNPETRAYGGDGLPEEVLYQVCFVQHELWPESRGHPDDRAYVDIFEHWLEEGE
jgi:nitrile hydratase subunit beta